MKRKILTTIQFAAALCAYGQNGKGYPCFPETNPSPCKAPNVLLIILDDAGFGQFGTTGGLIKSPNMDVLYSNGIIYNRFHTVGMSSPTRAALLTGRNSHAVSTGAITEMATGHKGYTSIIPDNAASIGEVLRQNGYATAWIGKNHNTPVFECSPSGPFDRWPNGLGFDYFYGLMGADGSQLRPTLYENTRPIKILPDEDYSMSKDFADQSIKWIRQTHEVNPDQPWFCYLAPAATHAPHQTPTKWRNKYKGKFDLGWDMARDSILANQIKIGIVPEGTELAKNPEAIQIWDTLTHNKQKQYIRMMELFAAYSEEVDHEVGRVIDYVHSLPNGDNTLIIWIVGDNGASAEGAMEGSINELLSFNGNSETIDFDDDLLNELGGEKHFNHFPAGWTMAMNTPFPWAKQVVSHLGAVRNPMIISWPKEIESTGKVCDTYSHVIDIYPTILQAAGINRYDTIKGVVQAPVHGVSLYNTFRKSEPTEVRTVQYYEMLGNRAIYKSPYLASYFSAAPWAEAKSDSSNCLQKWELYDLSKDFSQSEQITGDSILLKMQTLWDLEAKKYNVLPTDMSKTIRFSDDSTKRPNPTKGKYKFIYTHRLTHLAESVAPNIKNKSFEIEAEIVGNTNGMLFTQGGNTGGCALYFKNGKAVFSYNYLDIERYIFTSPPITSDSTTLKVKFCYNNSEENPMGAGGIIEMYANGDALKLKSEIIRQHIKTKNTEKTMDVTTKGIISRTVPLRFSNEEGQDIGEDNGTSVDDSYSHLLPFRFEGEIRKLTIQLK